MGEESPCNRTKFSGGPSERRTALERSERTHTHALVEKSCKKAAERGLLIGGERQSQKSVVRKQLGFQGGVTLEGVGGRVCRDVRRGKEKNLSKPDKASENTARHSRRSSDRSDAKEPSKFTDCGVCLGGLLIARFYARHSSD